MTPTEARAEAAQTGSCRLLRSGPALGLVCGQGRCPLTAAQSSPRGPHIQGSKPARDCPLSLRHWGWGFDLGASLGHSSVLTALPPRQTRPGQGPQCGPGHPQGSPWTRCVEQGLQAKLEPPRRDQLGPPPGDGDATLSTWTRHKPASPQQDR